MLTEKVNVYLFPPLDHPPEGLAPLLALELALRPRQALPDLHRCCRPAQERCQTQTSD